MVAGTALQGERGQAQAHAGARIGETGLVQGLDSRLDAELGIELEFGDRIEV